MNNYGQKELLEAAAELFEKYNLCEVKLKSGENEVYLKKEGTSPLLPAINAVPQTAAIPQTAPTAVSNVQISLDTTAEISSAKLYEQKSPLLGIFYSAPEPGAEPFVKVGDKVNKGDILCIVEAMKMMNEICAECDGTIKEICAEEGKIVEYNAPLFRIKV